MSALTVLTAIGIVAGLIGTVAVVLPGMLIVWGSVLAWALIGDNPYRWQDLTSSELFGGKKVVVFSLPGAFTPTCSSNHLPRYDELYEEFKAEGVDEIVCVSVNDAFVMFKWGKELGNKNIFLLPDGSGEFTRKMGMLVDKFNLGFGMRSWRYSMLVEDGQITKLFSEAGKQDNCPTDPFEVSDADTMLAHIRAANIPHAA